MLSATQLIGFGAGNAGGLGRYSIDYSCRFNSGTYELNHIDSPFLMRTGGDAGTPKTWTFFMYLKRTVIAPGSGITHAYVQTLQSTDSGSDSNSCVFQFDKDNKLWIYMQNTASPGVPRINWISTQAFRDPHAWYFFTFTLDTTPSTPIFKVWNWNDEITGWTKPTLGTVGNQLAQHDVFYPGTAGARYHVGSWEAGTSSPINGLGAYVAQCGFMDGTVVTDPVSAGFIELDINGVYRPLDVSGLDYGTAGHFMDFSVATTPSYLGIDATTASSDAYTPGVSFWENDGTGWANGNGTIDHSTAGHGNRSGNPISGDFVFTFTVTGQTNLKIGCFDAEELTTYDNTDDSAMMDTMTKSWYYNQNTPDMYYGSAAQSASPSIADGSVVTIERTGSTIKITDDGVTEHTFSQTFAGPVYLGFGAQAGGTPDVDLDSVAFTGARAFSVMGSFAADDRVIDTPTNNYCVFSPINPATTPHIGSALANDGGLAWMSPLDGAHSNGSIPFDSTDADGFYFEYIPVDAPSTTIGAWSIGIMSVQGVAEGIANDGTYPGWYEFRAGDGGIQGGGSGVISSATWDRETNGGMSLGETLQVAVKAGKIYFGVNDVWYDSSDDSFANAVANDGEAFSVTAGMYCPSARFANTSSGTHRLNCGNTGSYAYTKPTGLKDICTMNLAVPAIVDPSIYVQAHNYTGTGDAHTETLDAANNKHNSNLGTLDMLLLKNFATTDSPRIFAAHTELGNQKAIPLDDYSTIETNADGVTSIGDVNAFGLGTGAGGFNDDGESFSSYCFHVAKTAEDTINPAAASIASKVIVNDTAGWSMGTWEGTEVNATIGHGLSTKPNFLLLASLDFAGGGDGAPRLGFTSLGWDKSIGFTGALPAVYVGSTAFQDLAPTDDIFYVGSHIDTNHDGGTMFFFAAYDVPGFSTWGLKYEGTGDVDPSSDGWALGPLALYGFSAEFIWLMRTPGATVWTALDVIRDPYNQTESGVRLNDNVEGNTTTQDMDILSNGLKIRHGGGDVNDESETHSFYIMACAKNPFGGQGGNFASGVSPATAR